MDGPKTMEQIYGTIYDRSYLMKSSKSIKQKSTAKLFGITFDCNLPWNEQINIITKSTYGMLRVLKSFKRFTPFTTRKYLAESLILSRINYCKVVYGQMPNYLVKRFTASSELYSRICSW